MDWEKTDMLTEKEIAEKLGKKIGELLKQNNKTLATAESCTGGRIAACITSTAGCSAYFKGGIVAYANDVKENTLHVSKNTLERYGAVSEQTVHEMVKGAIATLDADYGVATSGIAGPDGGTKEKPVGTIWIAAGSKERIIAWKQESDFGREQNALRAVQNSLELLEDLLQKEQKDVF